MSSELLAYVLDKLKTKPNALNINQQLAKSDHTWMTKAWSKARFERQQLSILRLSPDHIDYGRSYLWYYELVWSEEPHSSYRLQIRRNLRIIVPPRELILLASVSELQIPFNNAAGKPIPRHVFRAAKSRMLGGETKRAAGAVAPGLRPAVATVQYTCQRDKAYLGAVNYDDVVIVEK